jgi:hypothetical protein
METHDALWRLWPSVAGMAHEIGFPASRLYRAQAAGQLPPAELDLVLLARAAASGSPLTLSEIALCRWRMAGQPGGLLMAGARI